ncbi:MAG: hypothetical protein GXO85_06620 [Chlorobi bacterium]|nr:hypothetical protein [Chlorobiota bacterium]
MVEVNDWELFIVKKGDKGPYLSKLCDDFSWGPHKDLAHIFNSKDAHELGQKHFKQEFLWEKLIIQRVSIIVELLMKNHCKPRWVAVFNRKFRLTNKEQKALRFIDRFWAYQIGRNFVHRNEKILGFRVDISEKL